MDRRITVLLALLFASSTMAAGPMTPSRDSLSVGAFRTLNMPTTGTNKISTTTMYDAINQGLVAVCRDFPALERLDTVVFGFDSQGVALNTDFLRLKAVYRIDRGDSMLLPIPLIPIDSIQLLSPREDNAEMNKQELLSPNYAYSWGQRLFTVPKYTVSSHSDSFLVYYYAIDDKLTSGTDSTSIEDAYLPALRYYTCFLIETARERYDAAAFWYGLYEKERNAVGKPRESELKK